MGLILILFTWINLFIPKYNGIDISHHNKVVYWEKLQDVEFCYIKATEGSSFKDPKCYKHYLDARKHKVEIGLYHYFRTGVSPSKQFKNFKSVAKNLHTNLIPMIDVENVGNDFSDIKQSNKELSELINLFYKEYGKYPIIYVGTPIVITSIYKCPLWIRCLKFHFILPDFTIKQIEVRKIGKHYIDLNYCSDIKKLYK